MRKTANRRDQKERKALPMLCTSGIAESFAVGLPMFISDEACDPLEGNRNR